MTGAMRGGAALAILGMLAGCGGGGGGSSGGRVLTPSGNSYTAGVFQPSSSFAALCAAPRAGTADRQGSATSENNFLRSWTHELYLWYREAPDLNPASFSTPDYFERLRTSAITASGQPKDKFHFTFDTADWEALSQAGVAAGYGAQWIIIGSAPTRRVVAAYTEPGSPAITAGLSRGVEVLTADGVSVASGTSSAQIATLNAAFFPDDTGQSHTFQIRELTGTTRTVTMSSADVTSTPVQNVAVIQTGTGPVGYILFNDHIATSEPQLISAINTLRNQSVVDLVLDIRYNGGGFLDIASELAYMIAGSATGGRTFEKLVFNDQHPTTNPVTGQPLTPTPFHTTAKFISAGQSLPTLNLQRVYVLTGDNTCSASESIINSLSGIDVDVYQIGSTTCGKPYGFYPESNCGTTYFSIQFQGLNEKNFGDYSDGYSPQNTVGLPAGYAAALPGCSVADDFTRQLGDALESRLAAALNYRMSNNQQCPAASGFGPGTVGKPGLSLAATDGVMHKSPWRENRILID